MKLTPTPDLAPEVALLRRAVTLLSETLTAIDDLQRHDLPAIERVMLRGLRDTTRDTRSHLAWMSDARTRGSHPRAVLPLVERK